LQQLGFDPRVPMEVLDSNITAQTAAANKMIREGRRCIGSA